MLSTCSRKDALFPWKLSQLVLCPLFIGCAAAELRRGGHRCTLVSGLLLLAAVLLDIAGVGASMFSHASCTKLVFLLLFVVDGVTNPSDCKFTVVVPEMVITDAIQIIPCSDKAAKILGEVKVWTG